MLVGVLLRRGLPLSRPPLITFFRAVTNAPQPFSPPQQEHHETFAEKFVASTPLRLQPYLKLSRIHKPIGTWLLFWPATWGLSVGAAGLPPLDLVALFGLGAFVMRGAGCTINDMWDREIDKSVSRTKGRPLASGQLRLRHAFMSLAAQLSLALSILPFLPQPCTPLAVASLGLVVLYPVAKRFTSWPQAVLGLTFNTGILMGYTAVVGGGWGDLPWLHPSVLALYSAAFSWTLVYDTIYAHQDRTEDTLLGLGSTARCFGDRTKWWLSGFGTTMMLSLGSVGVMEGLSWPYYAGVSVAGAHLLWQIVSLDIKNGENCGRRFASNRHVGWIILLSLIASYELQKPKPARTSSALLCA